MTLTATLHKVMSNLKKTWTQPESNKAFTADLATRIYQKNTLRHVVVLSVFCTEMIHQWFTLASLPQCSWPLVMTISTLHWGFTHHVPTIVNRQTNFWVKKCCQRDFHNTWMKQEALTYHHTKLDKLLLCWWRRKARLKQQRHLYKRRVDRKAT